MIRALLSSSIAVRTLRRLTEPSRYDVAVRAGLRLDPPALPEAESTAMRTLLRGSAVAAWCRAAIACVSESWPTSAAGRLARAAALSPVARQVHLIGIMLLTAVATHTVVFAVLGIDANGIAWGARLAVTIAALVAMRWPDRVGAAWRKR